MAIVYRHKNRGRVHRSLYLAKARLTDVTRDQEIWAVALWVERQHDVNGPAFIAEQMGVLAQKGDTAGIRRWYDVATAYDQIMVSRMQIQ